MLRDLWGCLIIDFDQSKNWPGQSHNLKLGGKRETARAYPLPKRFYERQSSPSRMHI